MKLTAILGGLMAAANLYLGLRFLLNVVGLLHTTKYGPIATAVYALLFLGLGGGGLYAAFWAHQGRLALLLGLGPWLIALVGLIFSAWWAGFR